jgi:type II secretory ATPase GspE/PulE/Tfp pilus assembly ATPase PilB-like protein
MTKQAEDFKSTSLKLTSTPVTHLKIPGLTPAAPAKPVAPPPGDGTGQPASAPAQPQAGKPAAHPAASPEVAFVIKFQNISNKIQAARNLEDILINLRDEIADLFESERITIYVIDGVKRELVSKVKSGNEIAEIRIPVSPNSIAGYAAHKQRMVNIKDVYDAKELALIDPELKFDQSWDKKTGFRTRQVLVCPIFFHKYLLGAVQLINKKTGDAYNKNDDHGVKELAKALGIAMYNQKRAARQATNKFNHLLQKHLLTQKELAKAIEEAKKRRETIENYLLGVMKIDKKELLESLGKYYEVPSVIYEENIPTPILLLQNLKIPFLKTNFWVPLRRDGDKITIAIDDPHNLSKIDAIKSLFPNDLLEFKVALKEDILEFIEMFTGKKKRKDLPELDIDSISDELLKGLEIEAGSAPDEDAQLVSEESSAVVKLVNKIIMDAYTQRVSDIHVEPQPGKEDVLVRTRIDGACREYPMRIPYIYRSAIVSRIKIMSGLDIAERRMPQDGKIQFKKYGGLDIELRVATIPTQGGVEDIVMRILAAGEPLPLDKMGFSKRNYEGFVSCVSQPYGIIFVCGPTGSGKTTTLHSALKYINKVETKIWTAEDPVEITQRGLRQVQVQPKIGFDFARAMRAFLRADPDVIMVGEMRDKETTHIGIEASLTGHLVFSTLHTNSAPESITRLLDMGMDPFNFADAVLCILAQRLIRTLCKNCKEKYHPTQEEYDDLVREYGKDYFEMNKMHEMYPYNADLMLHRPRGCDKCNQTGYSGRMGIHELLLGTRDMKQKIQSQSTVDQMREQAIIDGMRTLKQDGIEKIFAGFADLIQVRKVCIN